MLKNTIDKIKKITMILIGLMIATILAKESQLVGESDGNDRKYCFYDYDSSVSMPLGGYCSGFK